MLASAGLALLQVLRRDFEPFGRDGPSSDER